MRELEHNGIETCKTDEVGKISASNDLETIRKTHQQYFLSHSYEARALVSEDWDEICASHQSTELNSNDLQRCDAMRATCE